MRPPQKHTVRPNPYAQELGRLETLRRFVATLEAAQKDDATHVLLVSDESYTFYAFRQRGASWQRQLYIEDSLGTFRISGDWRRTAGLPREADRLTTVLQEEQRIAEFRHAEDSELWTTFHSPRSCTTREHQPALRRSLLACLAR